MGGFLDGSERFDSDGAGSEGGRGGVGTRMEPQGHGSLWVGGTLRVTLLGTVELAPVLLKE